jgi:hypothetical protein
MGERLISGVVAVIVAIIGIAILAVIVSKQSQTASVITQAGGTFNSILKGAVGSIQ